MTTKTILEGFGLEPDGFTCDECGILRRYYDRLSDGTIVCLECSTKNDYALDVQGTYHERPSELMTKDPELALITENIVKWKLDSQSCSEITLKMSDEVLEQLYEVAEKTGTTVETLINAGASLILNGHAISE